jgi:uncharacterized protein (DUF1800 family)
MPGITRRDCLTLGGLAGAAALAASSGCSEVERRVLPARRPVSPTAAALPPTGDLSPVVRLLNRAAFGPVPGDIARVAALGTIAYVDEQLKAPVSDDAEDLALQVRLRNIDVLNNEGYDLRDLPEDEVMAQLQQAAILRAVYSPWQLRARMVDFWSNHFNIYARKDIGGYLDCNLIARDNLDVIRTNALGTFPALLRASARSPAMLGYLDNQKNKKGVANENYAREIMELHTLGVDGGYTQKDVQEVARCLTGWTVEDRFLHAHGTFLFDEDRHDDGEKVVLGHRIPPGGGERDGDRVLTILATHPSCARFIAKKMVRYYYGEEDADRIAETAAIYQKTDGDLKAMVRHLLTHPALHSAPPALKRPFDFVVSALRATEAETDGKTGVIDHLAKMGQELFQWPMPDGYPDKTAAWTGSLLARWNFAVALTQGKVPGTSMAIPERATLDTLTERLLGRRPTDPTLAELRTALLPHAAQLGDVSALLLASPAFQWR